jgi:hypothetical protein
LPFKSSVHIVSITMRCHTEGMRLTLGMHEGKIYRAEMPDRVLMAIKDTEVRLKTAPIAGNQLRLLVFFLMLSTYLMLVIGFETHGCKQSF